MMMMMYFVHHFAGATLSRCIDFSRIPYIGGLLHFSRYLSEFMGSGHNIFNTIFTLTIHKHTHHGSDISTETLVSTQTGKCLECSERRKINIDKR